MSYAIGEIVYGVNLSKPFSPDDIVTLEQREAIDNAQEAMLVQFAYSGSGDGPVYVGPVLCEIDECNDVEIKDLIFVPTAEQMCEFVTQATALVEEFPVLTGLFNEPTVFITWGSS